MKYETILAYGYWLDDNQPYRGIVALGSWDGIEDAEDEEIDYYLDGADPIGKHEWFVIYAYARNNP